MSYCMFQNTLNDLRDCYEELSFENTLSTDEEKAKTKLIKLCKDIYQDFGDFGED